MSGDVVWIRRRCCTSRADAEHNPWCNNLARIEAMKRHPAGKRVQTSEVCSAHGQTNCGCDS